MFDALKQVLCGKAQKVTGEFFICKESRAIGRSLAELGKEFAVRVTSSAPTTTVAPRIYLRATGMRDNVLRFAKYADADSA